MGVALQLIQPELFQSYVEQTERTYTKNYLDVDKSMPTSFLQTHSKGSDKNGYMTLKKEVFSIQLDEQHIGFTTMTYKRGLCIKTGPTIIYEKFRGMGLGPKTQEAIVTHAKTLAFRKTYGTVSENAPSVQKYMLNSGYLPECTLKKHYHNQFDEIVYGRVIRTDDRPISIKSLPLTAALKSKKIVGVDVFNYETEILNLFDKYLVKTDSDLSVAFAKTTLYPMNQFSSKPKRLFAFYKENQLVGAMVAILKRGGALKVNLVGDVGFQSTLNCLEELHQTENVNIRKVTFFLQDFYKDFKKKLIASGYIDEGIINEPYMPKVDVSVISKIL
jgi:hypothetical protein